MLEWFACNGAVAGLALWCRGVGLADIVAGLAAGFGAFAVGVRLLGCALPVGCGGAGSFVGGSRPRGGRSCPSAHTRSRASGRASSRPRTPSLRRPAFSSRRTDRGSGQRASRGTWRAPFRGGYLVALARRRTVPTRDAGVGGCAGCAGKRARRVLGPSRAAGALAAAESRARSARNPIRFLESQ